MSVTDYQPHQVVCVGNLQEIAVDFVIATNHLGRIDVSICDLDAKPGDKKCQQLTR